MRTTHRLALTAALFASALLTPGFARAGQASQGEDTVTGTLLVAHSDDFQRGVAKHTYWLDSASGRYKLAIGRLPERVQGGMRVRVRGQVQSGTVLPADGESVEPVAEAPASGYSLGDRRTAVIMFNFTADTRTPYTADQVRSAMFTSTSSVNAYYREQSFAKVSFVGSTRTDGDVFGWYTIAESPSTCAYSAWASAAKAKASTAGVNLSAYEHIVYLFPQVSSCAWAGLAYVPGKESWINGAFSLRVVGHELGHNLGAHHAGTLSCTNSSGQRVAVSSSCSLVEYGDPFDIMGSSAYHTSNWHKAQFSWFSSLNTVTATASGRFTLAPMEQASTGVQLVRIPRGTTGTYYYLEFRRPYGFDSFASTDPVVNGVSIRIAPDYPTITQSQLVDTTPGTSSFVDSPLTAGRTFTDADHGLSVATASVSGSAAVVDVSLGGSPPPPPPPPPPTGDSEPPTAPSSLRGQGYTGPTRVVLSWGASTDNVGVTGYHVFRDGGWIGYTSSLSFTDSGARAGAYHWYQLRAVDAAGNASAVAGVGVSVPGGTDTQPPTAPSSLQGQALSSPTRVLLSWGASTDNVGVAGYHVFRDGAWIGYTSSLSLTDSGARPGAYHWYQVRAVDAAQNASAVASLGVSVPGGTDTQPPTAPTSLRASVLYSPTRVSLAWTSSSDNVAVAGYHVFRDGAWIGYTSSPAFTDSGAQLGAYHWYQVRAVDAAQNASAVAGLGVAVR